MLIKHAEMVARRKLGDLPIGFEFVSYEMIGKDACLLTGAVPIIGKRGGKKWPPVKKCERAVVTEAEVADERRRYEAETGNCSECLGKGEVFASYHHIDGVKNRPCSDCKATGRRTDIRNDA